MNERRTIEREARREGWDVRVTNGGHLRFTREDLPGVSVFGPVTPGGWRSYHIVRAKLRRAMRAKVNVR